MEFEGLSPEEARSRLQKYGPNSLPEKKPPSSFSIFASQLKSPLVYILLSAGLVTFVLGEIPDTVIIAFAVLINTILGFIQEKRASDALMALKSLVQPETKVVRGGREQIVSIDSLVPGDIVILDQGSKIPADGKLLHANRFYATEAALTGESLPAKKDKGEEVFMGTAVSGGRGYMEVHRTGAGTKMGKIAERVQEAREDTPLRRQLAHFSKQLTFLVVGLTTFVFIIGAVTGRALEELFVTAVALAVSAIPEGLLVALTVVLAIGMQRILKQKGLVRHLISAETLGSVTTISTDKTGTLTEGIMQVSKVTGDERCTAVQALLANDREDPITVAMYEWAQKTLTSKNVGGVNLDQFARKWRRLDSIPFNSKDRFFASLNKHKDGNMVYVNGAPEFVLSWSTLSKAERQKVERQIEKLSSDGMRLIGLAQKETTAKELTNKTVTTGLTWVGLIALSDPVREGVKESLRKTRAAGITTIVITGDFAQTAKVVMQQVGLPVEDHEIVLGEELVGMKEGELKRRLREHSIKLFARTDPEQKLKIVEALKENGEVVAMMGDGVNDAPALSKSDIGVVVGSATDVAKESADLVLLDSSFETIVMAIEEGRGIFANTRKVVLYLMSDAFSEIVAVVAGLLLGLPLPVTAAQILWINLVSDGLPHLALTVDPKQSGTMQEPPRDPGEPLVDAWMKKLIGVVSVAGGLAAILLFVITLSRSGDVVLARSVAFASLGINSLVYVFSIRTLRSPFWVESPFKNKWLVGAVGVGTLLQLLPFTLSPLQSFFEVRPLSLATWGVVLAASLVVFFAIELMKVSFSTQKK